jgi:hypothetical protein
MLPGHSRVAFDGKTAASPDSYRRRRLSLQLSGSILSLVHVRCISPAERSMSGDKLGLRMPYLGEAPWRKACPSPRFGVRVLREHLSSSVALCTSRLGWRVAVRARRPDARAAVTTRCPAHRLDVRRAEPGNPRAVHVSAILINFYFAFTGGVELYPSRRPFTGGDNLATLFTCF